MGVGVTRLLQLYTVFAKWTNVLSAIYNNRESCLSNSNAGVITEPYFILYMAIRESYCIQIKGISGLFRVLPRAV